MDWIRRNWPDMLIGIALVAVIAGIIATLLTGGSFFPLGASQASSSRPEQSTASTFEGRTTTVGNSGDTTPVVDENPATETTPVVEEEDDEPVSVSALPLTGSNSESEDSAAQDEASDAQNSDPAPASVARQPANEPVQLPGTDVSGTYRISVGAFSGEENAQRQAGTFRDAGYPVFIGTQSDLSIVLVGPYDQLAEAERVAERIRGGGFRIEPVIYLFQGESDTGSSVASSSPAPTPQPTAAQATAGRFLQVGAYGTRESSLPQRERLEGLGFRVSERAESGLVKLLVGPFAGNEMSEARALLSEQGIDHFPR